MSKKPTKDPNIEWPTRGRRKGVSLRHRREPSLAERIRSMVRSEAFALERESAGEETFEEADDFDVGDDYDPNSPYEEMFEGEFDYHRELRLEQKKEETQKRRKRRSKPEPDASDGAEPLPKGGSAPAGASDGESPT